MIWVFLQVGLAFGAAVAIVWWTWPKERGDKATPPKEPPQP